MWNIKSKQKNKISEQTKQKQTRRYREQSSGNQRERGGERAKWVMRINCMVLHGN